MLLFHSKNIFLLFHIVPNLENKIKSFWHHTQYCIHSLLLLWSLVTGGGTHRWVWDFEFGLNINENENIPISPLQPFDLSPHLGNVPFTQYHLGFGDMKFFSWELCKKKCFPFTAVPSTAKTREKEPKMSYLVGFSFSYWNQKRIFRVLPWTWTSFSMTLKITFCTII